MENGPVIGDLPIKNGVFFPVRYVEGISGGGGVFGNLCNLYLKPQRLKYTQKHAEVAFDIFILFFGPFSMDAVRPSSYMSNVLFFLREPL